MRQLPRKTTWAGVLLLLLISVAIAGCGKSGGNANQNGDGGNPFGPGGPGTPFDPKLLEPGPGGNTNPVGSGTGGGLTEADQFALKNVYQEQNPLAPAKPSGLAGDLLAEAKRVLEAERKGQDMAMQKMALAGRMLTECAKKTAPLAPLPGQPMLGVWGSVDNAPCKVNFTVAGNGSGGAYAVGGDVRGTMKADNNGDGTFATEPFTGRSTDRPSAATGTMTNPQFTKTKYGYQACSTAVALKNSANPIPANYREAIKQMGQCFRQALVLMSPVFDRMFANMNPQLRAVLQARMLGINL